MKWRALLDLRDFGRHADDDARAHPHVAVVGLLDEVRQHLLGDVEVGDDPVLHRLDGDDVAGCAAEHLLGLAADGFDPAVDLVHRDDGGLVDDDAATLAYTQVFAVPRSMARSVERNDRSEPNAMCRIVHQPSPGIGRASCTPFLPEFFT